MASFEWREEYSIDQLIIDQEHQKLLSLAREILSYEKATSHEAEIMAIIKEFYAYVRYHFAHEETIMEKKAYPLLDEHKELHARIVDDMMDTLRHIRSMTPTKLLSKFRTLAYHWVVVHILEEDMKFKRFLAN